MIFKNIKAFKLNTIVPIIDEKLMNEKAFTPCSSLQMSSMGWVSPLGKHSDSLIHIIDGVVIFCLCIEERILPSSVITDKLEERLDEIEEVDGKRPFGKYKQSIKDDIIASLIPQAFTRKKFIHAYIDHKLGMIVVNTGTSNQAEEVIEFLRQTLGSLPVVPLKTERQVMSLMTEWVKGNELQSDFVIGHECELKDTFDDGGIIKTKHEDLTTDEIRAHIDAGKQVTILALEWNNWISCVVDQDLTIKRFKLSDQVEENKQIHDDRIAQFNADFYMFKEIFAQFMNRLLSLLGGLSEKS